MLKLIGIIIIVTATSIAGTKCAHLLKRRVSSLEAFIKMFDSLEMKICTFATPLSEFFASYKDEYLEACGFLEDACKNGFSHAVQAKADTMLLSDQDINLLTSFDNQSLAFSASDEARRCHYYKNECEKLLIKANEVLPLYTRLLRSVGIMCGILTAVLFI